MSVLAFKQNVAPRVEENKRLAKEAVQRRNRNREPLLFHNGTTQRPVKLFYSKPLRSDYMTQADIDALPMGYVPMCANQLLGKIVCGELKRTWFRRRIR